MSYERCGKVGCDFQSIPGIGYCAQHTIRPYLYGLEGVDWDLEASAWKMLRPLKHSAPKPGAL